MLAFLLLLFATNPALSFDPFRAAGIDRRPDAEIPLNLGFRDEDGNAVTLAGLMQGKPILLIPVQHHCPNLCSVTLGNLLQSVLQQPLKPGADFSIIAFGIDPKEGPSDASGSLQSLLLAFPSFPRDAIHALTGSSTNIAAVTHALGYRYAWDEHLGQYDHVAATAVLTPKGHLFHWLYGVSPEPKDIEVAVEEASGGAAASWGDQLLLLCYHYDPITGRYSAVIWNALRGLAITVATALALLIAGLTYREFIRPRGRSK
jgi:protein SCO1/2